MTEPMTSLASMLFLASTTLVPLPAARAHGLWRGPGISVLVDVCRMQGRVGDAQPFTREPLVVIDTTDRFVVFFIGEQRFIGLFDGDQAELTASIFPESITLQRTEGLGLNENGDLFCS